LLNVENEASISLEGARDVVVAIDQVDAAFNVAKNQLSIAACSTLNFDFLDGKRADE